MNRSTTPRLLGALLAAGLSFAGAPSQGQSLGGNKPSGKVLTRTELKACMTQQDALKGRRTEVERTAATLQSEKTELEQAGEALKVDQAALDRTSEEAVAAYNDRARAHDQRVDAWNQRNATALQQAEAYKDDSERWTGDCADRRYREDDEKALRRSK